MLEAEEAAASPLPCGRWHTCGKDSPSRPIDLFTFLTREYVIDLEKGRQEKKEKYQYERVISTGCLLQAPQPGIDLQPRDVP